MDVSIKRGFDVGARIGQGLTSGKWCVYGALIVTCILSGATRL